ncbi:MAG: RND transporter [Hoeflea sp. BRH_c9]|nr:MAG: RND transporter [Hoeflea sp. BRH_c9]
MQQLTQILDQFPWSIVILACLTLGLAPFVPEPHIWEKLKMLVAGTLSKPIDIFDLLMHAAPFLLAGLKLAVMVLPAK